MHKTICHNDQIVPLAEARLSPGQIGLFNGWGLFTTLRVYGGQPFAFERHWRRLTLDAGCIQLPLNYSEEAVLRHLRELIQANQVNQGCARIYFIYNKVGFWGEDEGFPLVDLVMYTTDLPERQGLVQLGVRPFGRYAAEPLTGAKVTSWLQNVWSLDQAHRRGLDEVIMLNERGEAAECTAANLFCVRGGIVQTPPLSSGCLPGVTREVLLELGREIGVTMIESSLGLQDLYRSDEVFITSTTRQVQAVCQVEDHKVPKAPGPVTQRLVRAFSDYVGKSIGLQATNPKE